MLPLVLLLAVIAAAGVAFAFTGGDDSQAKALKRIQGVAGASKVDRTRRTGQDVAANRRKKILTDLKAVDRQQRKQSLTLEARLLQAGLSPNVRTFWIVSAVVAGAGLLLAYAALHNPLIALGVGFVAGLGLPRWALSFLAKRRMKKFTAAFPDATDIIVRGIKSGLPVHDCLKIIAAEAPKPLCDEFAKVVEGLGMGMPIGDCLEKLFGRMPTSEVRFFSIVLNIQQKTGGNLGESLNNLSVVLRARKLMAEKIKAMSGEAVASAMIIGCLPVMIMLLVQVTTPSYMRPLYTDPRGHIDLLIGAVWMSMGIFVMRKMINFKY